VEAPPALTPRQLDVLAGVIEGKRNKAIGVELGLSEATVKAHVTAVFKALGVSNRTQAVRAAERLRLKLPGDRTSGAA
jgi:DNA-binding NarL/FixJ family response regulator